MLKPVKKVFANYYFETFLITKRLNLKEIMLNRVLEFTDSNCLYIAACMIL